MPDEPTVARPDAAAHLAARFTDLRHPNGTVSKFAIFNPIGQPDHIAAAQKARAEHHAVSMIHELELAGYTLSHRDDPPSTDPTAAPVHKIAKIVCTHCARHIGALKVRPDGTVRLTAVDQQALSQLPTNCDDHRSLNNG